MQFVGERVGSSYMGGVGCVGLMCESVCVELSAGGCLWGIIW